METRNGVLCITASSAEAWRSWLKANHKKEHSVWLIIYKKASGFASLSYDEAVDEALCFGWIDSKPNKRDAHSYYQFFAKRNPKSNWSRVNKEKIDRLRKAGKLASAGLQAIEEAKQNGTWNALDEVEHLIIPEDLEAELKGYSHAKENFEGFPRSVKRGILEWIFNAKKEETRRNRVTETARLAAHNVRANQYTKK